MAQVSWTHDTSFSSDTAQEQDLRWHYRLRKAMRPIVKRGMDVVGAAGLLLVLAPALLLLAACVAADGGPVFFSHRRVGRGGREFGCLKFRSMRVDAAEALQELLERDPEARAEWNERRKLRADPRVTRIGRILRATSLDELPQLINVLRGEMSLVGPRPVLREELDQYYVPAGAADDYMSVRPGLTGAWQVSGRSDTSFAQRIALDVAYVQFPSLRKDLAILACTGAVVVRRRGAY